MKSILLLIILISLSQAMFAQYVYTIKADSVKITNCDSAELIIENHTQGVPGFLFNTGNGRTIFKRAVVRLDDTSYLLGADTLHINSAGFWAANGNHIYNTNTGNTGIHRTTPNVMLDLPGPVNIDDTSSYRINYHPALKIGGWVDNSYYTFFTDYNVHIYSDLQVGDSSGANNTGNFATLLGPKAGFNNIGVLNTFVGYGAGFDNPGDQNTFVGLLSGENNSPDTQDQFAGNNSFFGVASGQNNSGGNNNFFGSLAGAFNNGGGNTFAGAATGAANAGIWDNFFGNGCGENSTGDYNCFFGYNTGRNNTGSGNLIMGNGSGFYNTGSGNSFIGAGAGGDSQGDQNVFVGNAAGGVNRGTSNTYVGSNAGTYQVQANQVTLLGAYSSAASSVVTDATAIGYNAVVNTSNTMVFGDTAAKTWLFNSNAVAASGSALVVGYNSTNGNGAYLTTGGVWTNASDRFKKENFQPLDNNAILDKIAQLPITRWNYKNLSEQHIGPVAQDFYRIFHLGTDDKTISTIDPSGIALAGIQGLYDKIRSQNTEIQDLRTQLQKQQAALTAQQAQINQLLEKLNGQK